jgi:hypothetical protein
MRSASRSIVVTAASVLAGLGLLALAALDGERGLPPAEPQGTELTRLVAAIDSPAGGGGVSRVAHMESPRPDGPSWRSRVRAAERFAAGREGAVSFAVVAGPNGAVRGVRRHQRFPPASVIKSMLLAAELWRLEAADQPLDPETRSLLESMITVSDNDAASSIYARVGDEGLTGVAERVGMRDFEPGGSWGFARISAADMALLFADLDRALPSRYVRFAKGLLGSITPEQSWGLPAVADGWSARFKGGWLPTDAGQLVSQAAELRRHGRTVAVAILTDGQPSMEYGIETLETIGARLLGAGTP